jgi:hypothetical protein
VRCRASSPVIAHPWRDFEMPDTESGSYRTIGVIVRCRVSNPVPSHRWRNFEMPYIESGRYRTFGRILRCRISNPGAIALLAGIPVPVAIAPLAGL